MILYRLPSAWLLGIVGLMALLVTDGKLSAQFSDETPAPHTGPYHVGPHPAGKPHTLNTLPFHFKNLKRSTTWSMVMIRLNEPIDLTGRARLYLHMRDVSVDMTVKLELRDKDSGHTVYRNAWRYESLKAGQNRVIKLAGPEYFDDLHPTRWRRRMLWPNSQAIQYLGLIVESRNNDATEGSFVLAKIEYHPAEGQPQTLTIRNNQLEYHEYTPAMKYRPKPPKAAKPSKPDAAPPSTPNTQIDHDPTSMRPRIDEAPEPIRDVRRDDPSTALFISGAGYKLELTPWSAFGISGGGRIREETHRVDALLINAIQKKEQSERGLIGPFNPHDLLSEPIDTRNVAGSIIFDLPDNQLVPRFKFTYEDVKVDSDSAIELDFHLQVHEASALWTTPYLDDERRFRITFEPIFQYFRVTSDLDDRSIRRETYRGLINVVFHDEWNQREFFVQGMFGISEFPDTLLNETTSEVELQWRQWYGREKTAFSTLGFSYADNVFMPEDGRSDDTSRRFEVFGNVILELDDQGRWRWFGELTYIHHDIDIFITTNQNTPPTSINEKIDLLLFESRLTYEVLPDVDLSVGTEYQVARAHDFDSIALEGRVSVFNVGALRGEFIARQTWYYNMGDDLTTFSFELNFAR